MKFGNLYIKLFVSLFLLLIALQVYFFINLNFEEAGQIHPERNKNRVMKIRVLKALIEQNIRLNNDFARAKEELQEIVSETANVYDAKIWIEDSDGIPVLKSFSPEDSPPEIPDGRNMYAKFGDVVIIHVFSGGRKYVYTETSFSIPEGDKLLLNIFIEGELGNYRSQFFLGLAGIILIMAVFALSILQFIRVKVNRFRKSVQIISNGDLTHRVQIKGRGVVEDLGRTFNMMTDKLQGMINNSKEITANVSHEIRTPLARIRVVEELIRKKFSKGDFSGYERDLDRIREDIQILDDLTGRLLEFVKLDSYDTTPKHETFNPSELVNDLIVRFEPIIEYKNLTIKKDISFPSTYTGDKGALISAFLNILDNAFKYTPEYGKITIRIAQGRGFWEMSVTNSFQEMDQKDLDNIFKAFKRGRHSDNTGAGLGLAITKKIIEKHGGNITALNSEEGFEMRIRL